MAFWKFEIGSETAEIDAFKGVVHKNFKFHLNGLKDRWLFPCTEFSKPHGALVVLSFRQQPFGGSVLLCRQSAIHEKGSSPVNLHLVIQSSLSKTILLTIPNKLKAVWWQRIHECFLVYLYSRISLTVRLFPILCPVALSINIAGWSSSGTWLSDVDFLFFLYIFAFTLTLFIVVFELLHFMCEYKRLLYW